jgi:hypothetical protein
MGALLEAGLPLKAVLVLELIGKLSRKRPSGQETTIFDENFLSF